MGTEGTAPVKIKEIANFSNGLKSALNEKGIGFNLYPRSVQLIIIQTNAMLNLPGALRFFGFA